MKLQFRCGCGLVNYNLEDWLAHFKHGKKGTRRAMVLLMQTRIEII